MLTVFGLIPRTFILLPLVWLPLCLFTSGVAFFLAALGVFIRDVGSLTTIFTNMLLFLTPIFYPLTNVPEQFNFIYRLNPITVFIEDARKVVLWGMCPDWSWFFYASILSIVVLVLGFFWFMKSKNAFADVL